MKKFKERCFRMKNKETEQILLNDSNYEKFLQDKTETEFAEILKTSQTNEKEVVTDLKCVPKGMYFSKNSIYLVMDKKSKTKSYINGIQAEGFIESDSSREKLCSGEVDYFISGDKYIKFYKYKSCVNS